MITNSINDIFGVFTINFDWVIEKLLQIDWENETFPPALYLGFIESLK